MLKLRFNTPTYTVTKQGDIHRTICKLDSCIIDTESKEIIARLYHSGVAKCNPEDTFDPVFGRNLALSRAKLNSYNNAFELIQPEAEDSLIAIMFICTMSMNIMQETNHINFLFEEDETFNLSSVDLREFILANVEKRLPLLRGEDKTIPYKHDIDLHIG